MNASSTHTQKLISPSRARRRPAILPDCFFDDQKQNNCVDHSFCLLLSDSHGENFEDLLAAWCLCMKYRDNAQVIVLDDQREPDLCVQSLEKMFSNGVRPNAAIGHFSSPVAQRAAQIYGAHGVPFFAPGSSADTLTGQPSSPVFQVFAQDSGQVEVISKALIGVQDVVLFGQPYNAGVTLLASLQETLQCSWQSYSDISKDSIHMIQNRPLVILGSKEYVAEILSNLREGTNPSMIYLSDDSLGAAKVQQEALRLATPVFVTALRRTEGQNNFLGHAMDEIEHDAARILGRPTGPYFLTSWIAIYFALHGLGLGSRTSSEMLSTLQNQKWETIYGPIHFNDVGRAVGFTWELRSII